MGASRKMLVHKYCPQTRILAYFGIFIVVSTNVSASSFAGNSDSDIISDERFQRGRAQYQAMKAEASMPKYSKCWTSALEMLTLGCKKLDDDTQHRLAFAFTNCFLMKTGRQRYACSPGSDISECTQLMNSEAYNAYTEFFTHTQNICFFLQAQVWQAETQKTVTHLKENSALVAEQMEISGHLQNELLKRQNDSLSNQDILLMRGKELKGALEDSAIDVQHMMKDFQAATAEQRENIMDVFDRIQSLQSLVMGEFTGFYSMVFYTTSLIVCYLLTSTPRTNGARFWLFFLMTLNVVAERLIVSFGAKEYVRDAGKVITDSEVVYARLSVCRKISSVFGILLLLVKSMLYRDLNQINHDLLQTITEQNQQIKYLLQSSAVSPSLRDSLSIVTRPADINKLGYNSHSDQVDSALGYESDLEDSFDSGTTDHTYKADAEGSESEAESFLTSASEWQGRSSTPNLLEELQVLRDETPTEGITNIQPDHSTGIFESSTIGSGDARTSTPQKTRGRPPGRRTPLNISEVPSTTTHYNLRSRTRTPPQNPLVNTESDRDFRRVVQHLAKVSARNSLKTKYTIERRLHDQ